jgi:hypothetical protein
MNNHAPAVISAAVVQTFLKERIQPLEGWQAAKQMM